MSRPKILEAQKKQSTAMQNQKYPKKQYNASKRKEKQRITVYGSFEIVINSMGNDLILFKSVCVFVTVCVFGCLFIGTQYSCSLPNLQWQLIPSIVHFGNNNTQHTHTFTACVYAYILLLKKHFTQIVFGAFCPILTPKLELKNPLE